MARQRRMRAKSASALTYRIPQKSPERRGDVGGGCRNLSFCLPPERKIAVRAIFFSKPLDKMKKLCYNSEVGGFHAGMAQLVEHVIGNDEVISSTLIASSRTLIAIAVRVLFASLAEGDRNRATVDFCNINNCSKTNSKKRKMKNPTPSREILVFNIRKSYTYHQPKDC